MTERELRYNAEIAKHSYETMEFWRELLRDSWTANQAFHLQAMVDRLAVLRLERAYPPYIEGKGPHHESA
jgi:hypothetical protein